MEGGELSRKLRVFFTYSEKQFNYTHPIASIIKSTLYKHNHNGNEPMI